MTKERTNQEHGNERERVVLNVKHNSMDAVEALKDGEVCRFFKEQQDEPSPHSLYVFRMNEDTSISAYDCEGNETVVRADDIVNGIFYPEVYVNK